MTLNNSLSIPPSSPGHKGVRFEHGVSSRRPRRSPGTHDGQIADQPLALLRASLSWLIRPSMLTASARSSRNRARRPTSPPSETENGSPAISSSASSASSNTSAARRPATTSSPQTSSPWSASMRLWMRAYEFTGQSLLTISFGRSPRANIEDRVHAIAGPPFPRWPRIGQQRHEGGDDPPILIGQVVPYRRSQLRFHMTSIQPSTTVWNCI